MTHPTFRPTISDAPRLSRRTLLAGLGALAAGALVGCGANTRPAAPTRPWEPGTPLHIPPLLEPTDHDGRLHADLTLRAGSHAFLPGRPSPSWGINGDILGPTLRVRRGQSVHLAIRNDLPEMTTLHWHGLEVPAVVDGGPHQPIEPGATWTPELPIDQPAATLWYHPHLHGSTADHVHRGLAGLLIVDDDNPALEQLPHGYGIDDIPLILQDRTIAEDGSSQQTNEPNFGLMGIDICVNGTLQPYVDVRTDRVRLRVLNGSNARLYNLRFSDDRSFTVVANDSGLLPSAVETNEVRLGPAERAELVVALTPGETVTLRTRHGDERIDAGDLPILDLRAADALEPLPAPPANLGGRAPIEPDAAATVRAFKLQGHDAINGQSMDMTRIDEVVPRAAVEIWEVSNTVYSHNFHIHGVSFTVLTIDGRPPAPEASGRKDTVRLPTRQTARLAVQLPAHVDPDHPYMYHCHILRHEDAGMMGQFVVVEPGTEATTNRTQPTPPSGHGAGHDTHASG